MSRVCTPAPEAVDPMLNASPPNVPMVPHIGDFGTINNVPNSMPVQRAVVIKMGVEELRALITDVVQKAIDGLQSARMEQKSRTAGEETEDADMGEEIIVAGVVGESVVETIEGRDILDG
jgi:hypothetical protein